MYIFYLEYMRDDLERRFGFKWNAPDILFT